MSAYKPRARRAEHSTALDRAVRVGLVAYGVVHLLIAWLAVSLALGNSEGQASNTGALSQLAESPVGRISLFVVAAGFVALVVWQAIEAIAGHREEDGGKRVLKRVVSAGKAVVYAALAFSSLKIALGTGSSGGGTDSMTSKLMSVPGGQVLVVLVGLVIAGVACGLAYRGWTEKFLKKIDRRAASTSIAVVGKVGYLAKAVALLIVGGLFVWAGWTHDPKKSGGLDQALHKVLQQPYGAPMLIVIALGIGCYGLFCFAWARHLKR